MKRQFLTAMAVACCLGASALAQVGAGEKAAHPAGLTLKSALALADEKMAAAQAREARSALLPRLMFSESAARGDDPVYAFGTRLRQGRFSSPDFGLNRLNHPTPINDFTTRFSGQWSVLNPPSWLNLRRAEKMTKAAEQQLDRAGQQTVARAVAAYFGVVMAGRQQELAEQQARTARAVLEMSRARLESGTAVEADNLAAQVNDATRQMELRGEIKSR